MAGSNEDYLRRLEQDGRTDLIKRIDDPLDDFSLYAACIEMGYRKKKKAKSRAEHLAYHWSRSSKAEKIRFLRFNWQSVAPLVFEMNKAERERLNAAQISGEQTTEDKKSSR